MVKSRTVAERAHHAKVAQYPCMVCEAWPVELHHPLGAGFGLRGGHMDVLPLCPFHHRLGPFGEAIHNGTKTFEAKYGTHAELLQRLKTMMKV